ncbi:MAG: methyltransferase, CheR-type [Polyangiaceae bacterium]|nr:methyltransferase, CheR-type [Polyangiaceae bacterium]
MLGHRDVERLEVRLLLEAIYNRYGYDFRKYERDSMERRLSSAAADLGVDNLGELQHLLLHQPEVFERVLDSLTVRVTAMFRDPTFYRALRQLVIPALRTYPQIKIWHAGCASGEEVYATTILLTESGLYERARIYATDVSQVAVAQAREGIYDESTFSSIAANYLASGGEQPLDRYFAHVGGGVAVLPALKKNVHFFQHDLVSDYSPGEMQLIFCRNVLIYFGPELRTRAFSLFAEGLRRGGFLCLGASEALPSDELSHYQDISSSVRIYRRSAA